MKLVWSRVEGAVKYRVFLRTDTGWKKVADTEDTTYTDTTVVSGTKYKYTVRCISANGKTYTSNYDSAGKSITYVATPRITTATNTVDGVKLSWDRVEGAVRYRVFLRTETGWKKVGDTADTTYTDTTVVSGTKYKYTVRCINSDGSKYTSAYDASGKSITFVAAPKITKAENVSSGVKVTWDKVEGAKKYRVFRKVSGGKWVKLADTAYTTYTDKSAVSGTKYTYTVRCLNADGTKYTSAYDTKGKTITRS